MSTFENLGRDELAPGLPFGRFINPTAIERAAAEMIRLIKDKYNGIDEVNPTLWSTLGFGQDKVVTFLQRVVQLERERNEPYTRDSHDKWAMRLQSAYSEYANKEGIRRLGDYLWALDKMIVAGTLPTVVTQPQDYTPTNASDDIAQTVSKAASKIGLYIIGGLFAYGLATTLFPQLSSALFGSTRRY